MEQERVESGVVRWVWPLELGPGPGIPLVGLSSGNLPDIPDTHTPELYSF